MRYMLFGGAASAAGGARDYLGNFESPEAAMQAIGKMGSRYDWAHVFDIVDETMPFRYEDSLWWRVSACL